MAPTINCDLGEDWELYESGGQARLVELCDLANVCCGAHAGGPELTRLSMRSVAQFGRKAGAHPGYADRATKGRSPRYGKEENRKTVRALVAEQVGFAQSAAREAGLELHHVKPHGALYNEASAATDEAGELAEAIAAGVKDVCREVFLVGLADSQMLRVFQRSGFRVLREGFADRRYLPNGRLAPRTMTNAMLEEEAEIEAQTRSLAQRVDTLCVHADSDQAEGRLRQLRRILGLH